MRWKGKPMGMWMLFHRSFETHLPPVVGLDAVPAQADLRFQAPLPGAHRRIPGL